MAVSINTQDMYSAVADELEPYAGSRVRLTYRNNRNVQQSGTVKARYPRPDCLDISVGGHSGMQLEQVTQIEVMQDNGRYEEVWSA